MNKSFLTTILCGALISFSGAAFADTGTGDAPGGQRFGGQRGMRGQRFGGQRFGGQRGGMGGQRWGGMGGQRGGMGGQRSGMGFGGMMFNRVNKEAEIQKKFPEEFAKAVKQLIEAENKLQELARNAKVELPADNNHVLRQLKMKAPAEFAEIENKLKERETMREGFDKLRALAEKHNLKLSFGMGMGARFGGPNAPEPPRERGPQGRRNDVAKINAVRERFPEEWKKVLELRKSNPAEARKLTRELVQRLDAPQPAAAAGKTDGK